jgi:cytochrome c-type biogenesis protein CcmH/NrfG
VTRTDPAPERRADGGFAIHHHADDTKPRSQYLPMLEQAAKESPYDDRIAHYYARELFFHGSWESARNEFMRHLALPTAVWAPERAASYKYLADMDFYPERWLLKSVAEAPNRREGWVRLAEFYSERGQPEEAAGAAAKALRITERTFDYMTDAKSWDDEYLRTFLEV